jgi:hypothetical protein
MGIGSPQRIFPRWTPLAQQIDFKDEFYLGEVLQAMIFLPG